MNVILHIGAPKTGSSAIQYFLHENRLLLVKHGIYYPTHHIDSNYVSGGHAQLGRALVEERFDEAEALVETWIQEAEQAGCALLLSAEAMYRYPDVVASLFSKHTVRVLAYFRHPLESLISNHNQSIKRHYSTTTLSEFLYRQVGINNRGAAGHVFYQWHALFDDALSVKPYAFDHFEQGRIEYDFIARIGIQGWWQRRQFKISKRLINTSYTPAALELKRLLNGILDQDNRDESIQLDRALQRFSDRNNKSHRFRIAQQTIPAMLYEKITERYKKSLLRAGDNWLTCCPEDFLIPQNVKPDDEFTVNQQSLSDVLKVYQFLLAECSPLLQTLNARLARLLQGEQREQLPYSVLKLAEIMGLAFREPKPNPPLPSNAMDVFLSTTSRPSDYLREIAKWLERQTQTEHACQVLERALELAPERDKKSLQRLLMGYQQRLTAIRAEAEPKSDQD
jgi:hypothetical protein